MKKDVALALLGLNENELNLARINEAYKIAIQMNHPDRYAQNEQLRKHAEEQCKLINEAREVLLTGNWDEDYSSSDKETAASHDSTQPVRTSISPFLDIWKTSTKYSIFGILLNLLFYWIEDLVPSSVLLTASIIRLMFIGVQFIYALTIYPSLFGLKPKLKNSNAVSFLNCAIGGFIFGPLWNSNLTARNKGISNIVFSIFTGLVLVLWLLAFGYLFALTS